MEKMTRHDPDVLRVSTEIEKQRASIRIQDVINDLITTGDRFANDKLTAPDATSERLVDKYEAEWLDEMLCQASYLEQFIRAIHTSRFGIARSTTARMKAAAMVREVMAGEDD